MATRMWERLADLGGVAFDSNIRRVSFTRQKTTYGGLLPLATMLEKLQFQQLIEQYVTIKRPTKSMTDAGSCWP